MVAEHPSWSPDHVRLVPWSLRFSQSSSPSVLRFLLGPVPALIASAALASAICLHSEPPSDRRCLLRASNRLKVFLHPGHRFDCDLVECRAWCRLQSCCLAKPFLQPGQSQTYGRSSVCERKCPRKLKRLVKVLPHPGTGHTKWASFLLRLALAAWVADVVTCCFSTCRIGGRRGTDDG